MEKLPQQQTQEELGVKYGGDSSEYPKEMMEIQKRISEQLEKHYKWCEENDLKPEENEFYKHAHTCIAGTYHGKQIYINPGKKDDDVRRKNDITYPSVRIDGINVVDKEIKKLPHDQIREYQEKAQKFFDKLAPYVAYDEVQIQEANKLLSSQHKEIEKRRTEEAIKNRELREQRNKRMAEVEKRRSNELGNIVFSELLGIDSLSSEKTEELIKAIDAIKLPEKDRWNSAVSSSMVEKVCREKREKLLELLHINSSEVSLAISEKASQMYTPTDVSAERTNPRETKPLNWEYKYTVCEPIIHISGAIKNTKLQFEARNEFITDSRSEAYEIDKEYFSRSYSDYYRYYLQNEKNNPMSYDAYLETYKDNPGKAFEFVKKVANLSLDSSDPHITERKDSLSRSSDDEKNQYSTLLVASGRDMLKLSDEYSKDNSLLLKLFSILVDYSPVIKAYEKELKLQREHEETETEKRKREEINIKKQLEQLDELID